MLQLTKPLQRKVLFVRKCYQPLRELPLKKRFAPTVQCSIFFVQYHAGDTTLLFFNSWVECESLGDCHWIIHVTSAKGKNPVYVFLNAWKLWEITFCVNICQSMILVRVWLDNRIALMLETSFASFNNELYWHLKFLQRHIVRNESTRIETPISWTSPLSWCHQDADLRCSNFLRSNFATCRQVLLAVLLLVSASDSKYISEFRQLGFCFDGTTLIINFVFQFRTSIGHRHRTFHCPFP